MTDTHMIDVLVVGAGPVGLTLAIDLARRGVTCRIIEQSSTYQIGTRGRGISMRSQQVFEDLGILETLKLYDESMGPNRNYDHDKVVSESNPADLAPVVPAPYRPALMLSQSHTEAVLRERLAWYGLHVELGCQLVGFTQNAESVVASVTHDGVSEEIQARYLVGCDGGRSTVRKVAGIAFLGETWEEEHHIIANLSVSGLDPHYSHTWGNPLAGGLALQWMGHSQVWFFSASVAPDEHGEFPAPTLETVQRLFDERAGYLVCILATPPGSLAGVRIFVWWIATAWGASFWRETPRMLIQLPVVRA
ncbi:MAG TPA: FAD-dependent oxidoreductase [Ktedonobacteraceae bacterium]|nr:FAD-dependent oxidoreductase [Ktedonobacteraceae bacterium]